MVTDSPRFIRASIGPKVLSRAPQLFDHKPKTVISELIQNARRAGATAIDVTTASCDVDGVVSTRVTIADNGAGVENPERLITFGGSDWDAALDIAENAAGMGFFALAPFGASVRSRDWEAVFTPAAFTGEEDVVVCPRSHVEGTSITFVFPARSVDNDILAETQFLTIPVRHNGTPVPQNPFLTGAITIVERLGVKIGVFVANDHVERNSTWHRLNFFGHVVDQRGLDNVAESYQRDAKGKLVDGPTYFSKVDVVYAPDLALVLPTRDNVIQNDAWRAIVAEAERAIYETIAAKADHTLSFRSYKRALELGVAISPPKALPLAGWSADAEDENTTYGPGRSVIVSLDCTQTQAPVGVAILPTFDEQPDRAIVGAALNTHTLPYQLLAPDDLFVGYAAYDAIPVAKAHVEFTKDDSVFSFLLDCETPFDDYPRLKAAFGDAAVGIADAIHVVVSVRDQEPARIPAAAYVTNPYQRAADAAFIMDRNKSIDDIWEAVMAGSWTYSDDDDSDALETEGDALLRDLRKLLLSSRRAAAENIHSLLSEVCYTNQKIDATTTIVEVVINTRETRTTTVRFSDGTEETVG